MSKTSSPNQFVFKCILVLLQVFFYSSTSGQTYFANGDAKHVGGDCYQLTEQQNWNNGTVWYAEKIDLLKDFDLEFYMNFGNLDGGADGIVFVLQNKGNQAIGTGGGGLGYEGFSPSFGIEFDDFQNTNIGDPVYDHIAVFRDGFINHSRAGALHPAVKATPDGANIEDGMDHLVRVKWTAKTKKIEVYFDCDLRIEMIYDIQRQIFNGQNLVFWGFTAATGGLNNKQTVCLRKDILVSDTIAICKGDTVPLNSRKSEDNTYRWFPSTDLSDTTIKQPLCSSIVPRAYYVEFTDLCGDKITDTVQVVIDQPFTMDEVQDTLLCDGIGTLVDLRAYDSVMWTDGYPAKRRWLQDSGYFKVRAWQGVCWDDDSLNITTGFTPKIELTGDTVFCEDNSVVLKQSVTPNNITASWHTGSTDSVYNVVSSESVYVSAKNSCGVDTARLTVRQIILPNFTVVGDTIYCGNDSVELRAENTGSYMAEWENGLLSNSRKAANGRFKAKLQDHQCIIEDSIDVVSRPQPKAVVPDLPLMCLYETLILTSEQPGTERLWSTGVRTAEADYSEEEGLHWLKVYNACGMDSTSFEIERKLCTCDVYLPNAFTPNSDNLNDVFRAVADCDRLNTFELVVFNRWGQELFSTTDINTSWNGLVNEKEVPAGLYLWKLTYAGIEGRNNAVYHKSGFVYVME